MNFWLISIIYFLNLVVRSDHYRSQKTRSEDSQYPYPNYNSMSYTHDSRTNEENDADESYIYSDSRDYLREDSSRQHRTPSCVDQNFACLGQIIDCVDSVRIFLFLIFEHLFIEEIRSDDS